MGDNQREVKTIAPDPRVLSLFLQILLGVLLFLIGFGPAPLSGTWVTWMNTSSREQYQAAWLAFRHADWSLPIGKLPIFFSPHGSSVAFMDGAPWYLSFLKLLQPVLPENFPAWGVWICICCMLQAVFSGLLMQQLTNNRLGRILGTLVLSFSPVFIARNIHFALMAHWFVLAAWYLFFREDSLRGNRWQWAMLMGLVAGIHPYLSAMVLGIRVWALLFSRFSLQEKVFDLVLAAMVILAVFLLFGYFGNGATRDSGADLFSADIATLFVPLETSSLWPRLPARFGEDEGFGFLGAGGVVLAVGALLSLSRRALFRLDTVPEERERQLLIQGRLALVFSLLLFVFSLGPIVRFLGAGIVSGSEVSNPLYRYLLIGPLQSIPEILRAPGRFVWPLYYLLLALGCRAVSTRVVLVLAVALLQLADVGPYIANRHLRVHSGVLPPLLRETAVKNVLRKASKIEFMPPEPRELCDLHHNAEGHEILKGLILIAAQEEIPLNSGLQARVPVKQLRPLCHEDVARFLRGDFDSGTAYLVENDFLGKIQQEKRGELSCRQYGNFSLCLKRTSEKPGSREN